MPLCSKSPNGFAQSEIVEGKKTCIFCKETWGNCSKISSRASSKTLSGNPSQIVIKNDPKDVTANTNNTYDDSGSDEIKAVRRFKK